LCCLRWLHHQQHPDSEDVLWLLSQKPSPDFIPHSLNLPARVVSAPHGACIAQGCIRRCSLLAFLCFRSVLTCACVDVCDHPPPVLVSVSCHVYQALGVACKNVLAQTAQVCFDSFKLRLHVFMPTVSVSLHGYASSCGRHIACSLQRVHFTL
jgi:hypothetical protein